MEFGDFEVAFEAVYGFGGPRMRERGLFLRVGREDVAAVRVAAFRRDEPHSM